jgi:hypothetical protein
VTVGDERPAGRTGNTAVAAKPEKAVKPAKETAMTRHPQTAIASALTTILLIGAVHADSTALPEQRREASPLQAASQPAARNSGRPAPTAQRASAGGSPLSFVVQGPAGNEVRLDYVPGNGWQSTDAAASGGEVRKVAANEDDMSAASPASADASAGEQPLSVVIDGPTGFVYVWSHDSAAWKFVGHISDRRP